MNTLPFNYHYGTESEQYTFLRIPRLLITAPHFKNLSMEAKVLYGLMLDRMGLSMKNQWFDDQNRVYIYFTLEEIQECLSCGHNKGVKLLAELDTNTGIGLIERIKQGQGKPTRIYVKNFNIQPNEEEISRGNPDFPKQELQTSQNRKSRLPETGSADFPKTEANYNNINKLKINDTEYQSIYPHCAVSSAPKAEPSRVGSPSPKAESSRVGSPAPKAEPKRVGSPTAKVEPIHGVSSTPKSEPSRIGAPTPKPEPIYSVSPVPKSEPSRIVSPTPKEMDAMDTRNAYHEIIKENIDYDDLCAQYKYCVDEIDELVGMMVEMVSTHRAYLRINQEDYPAPLVKSRILKMDYSDMEYLLDTLSKNTGAVHNIRAYLYSCIYNAKGSIVNHYKALVNHDMYARASLNPRSP